MPVQPANVKRLPQPVRLLLEARLQGELDLPFLPDTAAQVLSLCNDETCEPRKLSELIQRDPSLAGHVLRVANSAAYAPTEPIHSLPQAVSRLGFDIICEISVAVSLRGRVFEVPGFQTRVRAMWMHSAAAAVYAKEVARFLRRNVEGAFLCGLLHDVGKPIVLQELVDLSRERTSKPVPAGICEAAMDEFHERIGGQMVRLWKLAPWMAEVVLHHHDPDAASEHADEMRIVRLADLLAHWALDDGLELAELQGETRLLADLNLYPEDLAKLCEARTRVIDVAEAFL
jgi:putative nucleotidyltransferase with HDIG domain